MLYQGKVIIETDPNILQNDHTLLSVRYGIRA
jgi:hypothetical protein